MKHSNYFICLLAFIIVYMLPYLLNGNDSILEIHDNLDSGFAHLKLIKEMGATTDGSMILPLLGGLPREAIPFSSIYDPNSLFCYILPGAYGLLVNIFLIKLIAAFGMFIFLRNYILKVDGFAIIVALIFSHIPFYPNLGISSAGIPMLLYALLNLRYKKKKCISLLLVMLYAFYSSLALSGLFVCFFIFIWIIALYYEEKKINCYVTISFILLCAIYLFSNWTMIFSFFSEADFKSHRIEMVNTRSFKDIIDHVINIVLFSQYHAGSFWAFMILFPFLLTIYKYRNNKSLIRYLAFYVIVISCILIGALTNFLPFGIFSSFQFERFYFLYPAVCFILLAKTVSVLRIKTNRSVIAIVLMLSAIGVTAENKNYLQNVMKIVGMKINTPSFRCFYDEVLFGQIANDINISQNYSVKVVSIGMFPSIAEYNGFWCLDAYTNSYPLQYKHQFREVISKELEKDKSLKSYFDDWGSRCYILSSEAKEFQYGKLENISIDKLDLNMFALKNLGCQYIFSSLEIKNYKELGLKFINSYTTPNSFWDIKVYKLQ